MNNYNKINKYISYINKKYYLDNIKLFNNDAGYYQILICETNDKLLFIQLKKELIENDKLEWASEPWFSLIKISKKKVEGRLNKGEFSQMKIGDIIQWENDSLGFKRTFITKIKKINHYNNFKDYLETES